MNETELNRRFPDLQGAQAALQRASQRARELAEKTGTQFVVVSRPPAATANKTKDNKR